ncbi:hypothetical protein JCM8208_001615 [Rhodotorula glutinis]
MGKLLGRLWVAGTLLLISFIAFSSQLFVVLPSYRYNVRDPALWRLLVPFNVLLALLYLNYALTVGTDPGRVPLGWEPDWRQFESGAVEVKKQTGGPRFCRTCRAFKPPRAHHCRQCKRCVLKMDHHCPWVNNCVGHGNYGHFCRFLFFVDLACAYHLWMISTCAFHSLAFSVDPSTFQIVMLVLNYTACVPVVIAVGVFSLYHLWSVFVNTTTIEGWEKDKVATLRRRGKIREYRYPYHLGYLANIRSVLGHNPLLWLWPQRAVGDGLSYPVAVGTDLKDQLSWPPRDPLPRENRRRPRPPQPGAEFTYGSGLNPDLLRSLPSTRGAEVELEREGLRARRPRRARRAPYEVRAGGDSDDDAESRSSASSAAASRTGDVDDATLRPLPMRPLGLEPGEDEDDVPLGALASQRLRLGLAAAGAAASAEDLALDEQDEDEDLDPERAVRIRRGSEGFEVRPRVVAHGEDDGDGWEHVPRQVERYRAEQEERQREDERGEASSEFEVDEEGDRRRVGPRYRYYVREEDSESDSDASLSSS